MGGLKQSYMYKYMYIHLIVHVDFANRPQCMLGHLAVVSEAGTTPWRPSAGAQSQTMSGVAIPVDKREACN